MPALLVTKWVHALEVERAQGNGHLQTELETQTIESVRSLLAEFEDDSLDHVDSLAAKLARYWASFYDDTWVWGVTPRMGWALRELAGCCERCLLDVA